MVTLPARLLPSGLPIATTVSPTMSKSESPNAAYKILIYLNDKYEIDGRDPNGYTGVAWCFGKHDRPWAQRKVFGNIRYMNDKGLKKKFDPDAYAKKINESVSNN